MNGKYRKEVRDWIREEIQERDSVILPEFTRETINHFMENNGLLGDLLKESLEPLVYQMAKEVLGESRHAAQGQYRARQFAYANVQLGDEMVTREEFESRAKKFSNRFSRWMEHAGDRHYNFMKMNATQLQAAADERRKRGTTEIFTAEFFERIAGDIGVGFVEEVYSPEQVDEIWHEMQE